MIWDLEIVHDVTIHRPLVATLMYDSIVPAAACPFVLLVLAELDGKIGDHHTQHSMIVQSCMFVPSSRCSRFSRPQLKIYILLDGKSNVTPMCLTCS